MVVGKTRLIVFFYQKTTFLIYFLPKTPKKHHRQLDKHIHGLKKLKNHLKTQNQNSYQD
jgi:hypothetical protein